MSLPGRSPRTSRTRIVSCAWYVEDGLAAALAVFYPMPEWTSGQTVTAILLLVARRCRWRDVGRAPNGAGLVWFVAGCSGHRSSGRAARVPAASRISRASPARRARGAPMRRSARAPGARLAGAGVVASMALGARRTSGRLLARQRRSSRTRSRSRRTTGWSNALGNVSPRQPSCRRLRALREGAAHRARPGGRRLGPDSPRGLGALRSARYGGAASSRPTGARTTTWAFCSGTATSRAPIPQRSRAVRSRRSRRANLRVALGAPHRRRQRGSLRGGSSSCRPPSRNADTPAGVAARATLTRASSTPIPTHARLPAARYRRTPAPSIYVEVAADGTLDTVTPLPDVSPAASATRSIWHALPTLRPFTPASPSLRLEPGSSRTRKRARHADGTREHMSRRQSRRTDEPRATNRG